MNVSVFFIVCLSHFPSRLINVGELFLADSEIIPRILKNLRHLDEKYFKCIENHFYNEILFELYKFLKKLFLFIFSLYTRIYLLTTCTTIKPNNQNKKLKLISNSNSDEQINKLNSQSNNKQNLIYSI
jgi:hypothetical protein